MTTTITPYPATLGSAIVPDLLLAYSDQQDSGTVEHDIIQAALPDVSLAPAGPRRGTLTLLFTSRVAAWAARAAHAGAGSFTLVDSDLPQLAMTYVVAAGGRISLSLDEDTRKVWLLEVDFTQIA